MDLHKLKWKMNYRVLKVKSLFKLGYYHFLKKFHLEGNDGFYYDRMRGLAESDVRTSAEDAYRDEFGPWPEEEPIPEEEVPEPDPDLIRAFSSMELLPHAITVGDTFYHTQEVKEYREHTVLSLQIMDNPDTPFREETIDVPHIDGQNYAPFVLDGMHWRWDRGDLMLRPCPQLEAPFEVIEVTDGVQILNRRVLRIAKALAEEKLSPMCLDYSFANSDEGYDWCICDHSYCTAAWELGLPTIEESHDLEELLSFYCCRYFASRHNS